jgi:hypothetical protein
MNDTGEKRMRQLSELAARLERVPTPTDRVMRVQVGLAKALAKGLALLPEGDGCLLRKREVLATSRMATDKLASTVGDDAEPVVVLRQMLAVASAIVEESHSSITPRAVAKITFVCKCGKTLHAPDTYAGRQAKCPACRAVVTVPATAGVEPRNSVREAGASPAVAASGKVKPGQGLRELEMTCTRDDLLGEHEYVHKAADMIASEGADAARGLAALLSELLRCRSPKVDNALTAAKKAQPVPELLAAVSAIFTAQSVVPTPSGARFRPHIAGGGRVGWDDGMADRVRKYAAEVLNILKHRQASSPSVLTVTPQERPLSLAAGPEVTEPEDALAFLGQTEPVDAGDPLAFLSQTVPPARPTDLPARGEVVLKDEAEFTGTDGVTYHLKGGMVKAFRGALIERYMVGQSSAKTIVDSFLEDESRYNDPVWRDKIAQALLRPDLRVRIDDIRRLVDAGFRHVLNLDAIVGVRSQAGERKLAKLYARL